MSQERPREGDNEDVEIKDGDTEGVATENTDPEDPDADDIIKGVSS